MAPDSTPARAEAAALAVTLGEAPRVIPLLQRILHTLGSEATHAVVAQAHAIDATGGMLVPDGSRRRTLGGIFFKLVKDQCDPEARQDLFPPLDWKAKRDRDRDRKRAQRAAQTGTAAAPPGTPTPRPPRPPSTPSMHPPFPWADRHPMITELRQEEGVVQKMKITLIGRPGKIRQYQNLIITTMAATPPTSGYPKGVPAPPPEPTHCVVYIGEKQWTKVATAIENPEDALIVEGVVAFDARIEGLSVHATNVTTKLLQQQQKKQPAAAE